MIINNPNLVEIESFLSTNLSRCCPGAMNRTPEMILNQSSGYVRGKKINLDMSEDININLDMSEEKKVIWICLRKEN